ncbi:MAG: FtsX-like permease family protein [Terrimicrobiaceae bacterium]
MTPRFPALFFRQVLRLWLRHPLLPALNILGIAAGVSVFLAIQIANRGALESFRGAVGLVAGRAHLEIRGDIPETLFTRIANFRGVASATPLVEGIATIPDRPGEYLRILGIDPFTGTDMRVFELKSPEGGEPDLELWLGKPGTIAAPASAELPEEFRVLAAGRSKTLRRAFLMETTDPLASADPRIAAMDIGWAQELLETTGKLTSIQITAKDPLKSAELAEALRAIVPPDVTVAPPARRGSETELMLAAFQLNLTALSLVSMVVGVFLIYNSLSAAVARRRREIGILRACGATRAEVNFLFLGEGLLCGLLGSLLGMLAAGPLAGIIAAPVGQTVTSLYTPVGITDLSLAPAQILVALAVGLGASLAAAWRPASEAASADPATVLRSGSAMDSFPARTRPWPVFGAASLAASAALSWWALQGGGKYLGFASVALVIAGFTLLVPSAVRAFVPLVRGPGWIPRLAAQHLVRSLHRNAVTIAALAVAAAMTVGVSVMIHSFRASVHSWLGNTLVADLFIAPAANEIAGLSSFLPAESVEWVKNDPRVREAATFREIRVPWGTKTATLAVVGGAARGQLEFLAGPSNAAELFHSPGHAAISESFANRHGVKPGDKLELGSPSGTAAFTVAGVVRDFTRDSGLVMLDRPNFDAHWNDPRLHSLSVTLHNPDDAPALAAAFRENFGPQGEFSIYTNSALRARVIEIFDQTFAVTSVLRAIAVAVAITGVLLSLATLVIEREREIGVLRSQGASTGQIRTLILSEAGMVGFLASIVGVACGAAMAMVLTWVINKAFFGWTIDLRYPWGVLFATPFWIIPAALLAAWIPAARAAKIPPARALRFE